MATAFYAANSPWFVEWQNEQMNDLQVITPR